MNSFGTVIHEDLYRYAGGTTFSLFIKTFLSKPGFRYTFILRLCGKFSKYNPIGLVARIYLVHLQSKYGIQIPHTTKIGGGFYIGHFGNIVVNSKVEIGRNCNISQGVTIGVTNHIEGHGIPKIGDRVWIGANAVIVGPISIGDNSFIGPLAFVNFNVPPNSRVVSHRGTILNTKGSEGYVNKTM